MKRFLALSVGVVVLLAVLSAGFVAGPSAVEASAASEDGAAAGGFDCATVTQIPQVECEALVTFYNATNGGGWQNNSGWLVTSTPCEWYGITCEAGHVVSLDMGYGNGIDGSLPSELADLTYLEVLSLENEHYLSGDIPSELGTLSSLIHFELQSQQLSGIIPPELGNLSQLETFKLLYGGDVSIPPELGNLISLQELLIAQAVIPAISESSSTQTPRDGFATIPPELGNLTNLESLTIAWSVGGLIPSELGNLSNLEVLDLSANIWLSGHIPPELGNLSNLETLKLNLSIGSCQTAGPGQISGTIPPELGNLTNLQYLDLYCQSLSGSIPVQLGNLTNLTHLDLSFSNFSGPFPMSFINLQQLNWLNYAGTNLCEPPDQAFQDWMAGVPYVYPSPGVLCGPSDWTPIVVTTVSDVVANDGACSLREAITAANTDTASGPASSECAAGNGDDAILLPAGLFKLSAEGADEDANVTGDLDLLSNIVLFGTGQEETRLDGDQLDRVLHVHPGATVALSGLTVQEGRAPDGEDGPAVGPDAEPGAPGGGILNEGALMIQQSTIRDNRAGDGGDGEGYGCFIWSDGGVGGHGGGILSTGPLMLNGVAVADNRAGDGGQTNQDLMKGPPGGNGGGIVALDTLSITDSVVSGNIAGTGGLGCIGPGGDGGNGGGAWTLGTTQISQSLVEANLAGLGRFPGGAGGSGGALHQADGSLLLSESTFRDNHAGTGGDGAFGLGAGKGGHGGGLSVTVGADALVEATLFASNQAGQGGSLTESLSQCYPPCGQGGDGGGLAIEGTAEIVRSTLSGNQAGLGGDLDISVPTTGAAPGAGGDGGGLWVDPAATAQLADSTVTLNQAGLGGSDVNQPTQQGDPGHGGGVFGESEVANSILASNVEDETNPSDCDGTLVSQGYNLVGAVTNCTITGTTTGNQLGVDALLGPLADNGGPTETHALLVFSPARDAGLCDEGSDDQRGFPRPIDLPVSNAANGCDIGAFEVQLVQLAPTSVEVAEGGATDSYEVVLNVAPTDTVTISIMPDDQTTVSPETLVFTPTTADQPQSVTVSAVDDELDEGIHLSTITHNASSADPRFQGAFVPDVIATITDNDQPLLSEQLFLPIVQRE